MTIWRAVAAVAALSLVGVSVSSCEEVAAAAGYPGVIYSRPAAVPKPVPRPALRCLDAAVALKHLKDHSGEIPAFEGVTLGGATAMITVSPSGTWTMMMATGDKLCPLAAGDLIKTEGAKPETNSLPAAPALLKNGGRLISD